MAEQGSCKTARIAREERESMRKPTPEEVKNDMAHLRAIEEIMGDFDAGKIDEVEARVRIANARSMFGRVKLFNTEINPV